jgi:2-(1,2-epoxy-1,2-dihydrophenyl)acetyl-CoA isomerase
MACDIRIAADTASFGEVYARIGALPDSGGTYFLPRLVGLGKACELIFTGDVIDAMEAKRIGLVNKVVPLDKLEETTGRLAIKLAGGPSVAIGLAKTLIYNGLSLDLATAMEQVASAIAVCFQTKDLKEGLLAYQEKRRPLFKGE